MALRTLGLMVAVLLVAVGALWTAQGLGYVEGSSMTGNRTWSVIGPLVAGFGVSLAVVLVRPRR